MLLYVCVGVLCALAVASIVAIAWLCDDRKVARDRAAWDAECKAKKDWYMPPHKGHPHLRANRDRDSV